MDDIPNTLRYKNNMKDTPTVEHLTIKNFLVIKEADFDVKRFIILMGEQATGKSLIAKLLYFFRESLRNITSQMFITELTTTKTSHSVDLFSKSLLEKFTAFFPKETWEKTSFKIIYKTDNTSISIIKKTGEPIKFILSEAIKKRILDIKKSLPKNVEDMDFHNLFDNQSETFNRSVFIPASRSLLSIIRRETSSLLGSGGLSDRFMTEFMWHFDLAKKWRTEEDKVLPSLLTDAVIFAIVSGEHYFDGKQDWIKMAHGSVPLANASSGQQEVLPMLLVLSEFAVLRKTTFFVEEPEAHLFPNSQRLIMRLLATIYNDARKHSFFLTTHSPYILVALNNLIMASNVTSEKKGVVKKVSAIIPKECHVRYEDVGAYTIENGKLISVMDAENKLINAEIIDHAADVMNDEFDQLLSLRGA